MAQTVQLDASGQGEPAKDEGRDTTSAPRRRVVAYYPLWARNEGYTPRRIDFKAISHVAHFAVVPKPHGGISIPDWGPFPDPELISTAHRYGVRVVLVVGGDHEAAREGFSSLAARRHARLRFVREVMGLVERHGYDGVDLDWEFPGAGSDRENLVRLVASLRRALGTDRTLSLGVPGSPRLARGFAIGRLRRHVDWFGAMTYSLYSPKTARISGHNAPLFAPRRPHMPRTPDFRPSVDQARRYYLRHGVPRSKLLIGVPFFGQRFQEAKRPYQRLWTNRGTSPAYRRISAMVRSGSRPRWDSRAAVPFLVQPSLGFVSYDNPRSVYRKCEYVRRQKLGGVIIWRLGQDMVRGEQPLLATARHCRQ